ncbi:mannosyl-3-phosphoglycerate synthase [Stetteria hydrogenophila]
MLWEYPSRFEDYGAVRIYDVVRVLEIDAVGYRGGPRGVVWLDTHEMEEVAYRTGIVIPAKNEDLLTLENVIAAVPHASTIILVSASDREPADAYAGELELVKAIHAASGRSIIAFHQRDPAWGEALRGTPLEALLDEEGLVRKGKGEGMILGVIAAAALGLDYVGFIDSDNYVPGAAHEYALAYYTGFSLIPNNHVMVRVKWPFKTKLQTGGIYLRRRGRVSQHTNAVLNYALSLERRIETEVISTANSGEHAMDVKTALSMEWAGGFAVESYQLVYLLEKCWLGLQQGECPLSPPSIKIFQVETRNPHIHAERGSDHIADMVAVSMGTIYYSRLSRPEVKSRIREVLESYNYHGEPPRPRVYPPPGSVDPSKVFTAFVASSKDAAVLGG